MRRLFLSASLGVLAATTLALPAAADESTPSASQPEAVADTDGTNATVAEPAAAKKSKPATAIEEITVTARKREENLQETPISITAFSAADLKDAEVRRIDDIQNSVPNLQFDQAIGQANAARIQIRGVGNGDPIISDDPGVGVYIDGVYLPRAQGALLAVSDIERVEVLRGPQGTLFGKNTIGGAVNIVTQKPTMDEFKGSAEVRVGNYRLFETKTVVNVPLVPEMAAARFSIATEQRDGYTKNRFVDNTLGRSRRIAGRAQFLVNASDNLDLNFSIDRSHEPNTPPAGKCKFIGSAANVTTRRDTPPNSETGAAALSTAAQLANTGDAMAFRKLCESEDASDEFKSRQDGRFEDLIDTWGSNLTATWAPSDAFKVRSISSWLRNRTETSGDADLTTLALAQDGRLDGDHSRQNAYSQEFNFSGVAMDNRLQWTTGVYGFIEKNKNSDRGQAFPITNNKPARLPAPTTPLLDANGNPVRNPVTGAIMMVPDPNNTTVTVNGIRCVATAAGPCGAREYVGPMTQSFLKSNSLSYAAYTQFTYDITDALSLTAGGRYTHERKRIARFNKINEPLDPTRFTQTTINNNGTLTDLEVSGRFHKWTPLVNLKYNLSDDINVYSTFSKGFKSGGFNGRAADIGGALEIEPEVLTSYELGFKSRFFDDSVQLNIAAFKNVYKDIQLTVVLNDPNTGNLVARTDNAGKAIIYGQEIEMTWVPLAGLTLNAGAGITSARYTTFDTFTAPGSSPLKNAKLPNTPAYTFTFGANYSQPLGAYGELRSRLGWSHTSEKSSDVTDPHINRIPTHGVMTGRITWALADGQTEISLFGNNLLDRTYPANAILGTSSTLLYYAPPRTYGLEVSRDF